MSSAVPVPTRKVYLSPAFAKREVMLNVPTLSAVAVLPRTARSQASAVPDVLPVIAPFVSVTVT